MPSALLETPPTRAATDNPHYARRWWILAVLGIAQLMVVLDATVVNIALPTAQTDLAFSDSARQWIVTAYALSFGSLLLLGGRIADVFGRKWTLVIGTVGFALASAVGGAAVNFGMLVTARAVQGVFAALLAPAILSLLTTTFTEPRERAKAFGIFGAIAGSGASVGLLLGGFLTEYTSWRWTLYVNLILCAAALVGSITLLHHSKSAQRSKLDLPGTVLVSGGLFALVYGFSHADSAGWTSPVTEALFVIAAVLLVAFVFSQTRVKNPLLPLRILLDRDRAGAYVAMLLASIGMFGVFLFLTYYLQVSLHYSAVMTGTAFLPMTGTLVVVAGVVSTVLVTRVSPRVLVPAGLVISSVAMYLLTSIGLDTAYASHVLPALILMGVGLGLVFAPAFNLGTLGVRAQDSGVASATINVVQQVGGAVGTALLNTIASTAAVTYASSHLTQPRALLQANAAVHSYTTAFWWAAGIFLLAGVLTAALLRSGVAQADEAHESVPAL
jgi:EmrB/QacA subfamily drug resistance transporter